MDSYENPIAGRTYISPRLPDFRDPGKQVRIATKVIEHPNSFAFAEVKGELVLRHHADGKTCITAKFFEDDRGIFVLSLQGYTVATLKPHNASFSFVGEEIDKLVEFINHIQSMPLKSPGSMKISDNDLRRLVLSRPQVEALLRDNSELFDEVLKAKLTREDVVAVGYRKRQLSVFEKLLNDSEFFARTKTAKGCNGDEALWQMFFEKNPWIFGYGLNYIYVSGFNNEKLEQVVAGYSVFQRGKRVDGLLRSRGVLSSLCFVEIKTHTTALLEDDPYRSGCWAASRKLAGAVAQIQGTVSAATQHVHKLVYKDVAGDPTGEEAYGYMPKSFLVVGSLSEFVTPNGVNEDRHRSFELFRRNMTSPEVITFDELYERARFIVQSHEP